MNKIRFIDFETKNAGILVLLLCFSCIMLLVDIGLTFFLDKIPVICIISILISITLIVAIFIIIGLAEQWKEEIENRTSHPLYHDWKFTKIFNEFIE